MGEGLSFYKVCSPCIGFTVNQIPLKNLNVEQSYIKPNDLCLAQWSQNMIRLDILESRHSVIALSNLTVTLLLQMFVTLSLNIQ